MACGSVRSSRNDNSGGSRATEFVRFVIVVTDLLVIPPVEWQNHRHFDCTAREIWENWRERTVFPGTGQRYHAEDASR